MKILKKLLDFSLVRWVENTEKKSHLEDDKYLLVVTNGDIEYLFTDTQVKEARLRALEQPEDGLNTAKIIA